MAGIRAETFLAWAPRALGVALIALFACGPWHAEEEPPSGLLAMTRTAAGQLLEKDTLVPADAEDLLVREILNLGALVPLAGLALIAAPRRRTPRLALAVAAPAFGLATALLGRATAFAFVFDPSVEEPVAYRHAYEAFTLLPLGLAALIVVLAWSRRTRLADAVALTLYGVALLAMFVRAAKGETHDVLLPAPSMFYKVAHGGDGAGLAPAWGARAIVGLLLAAVWVERLRVRRSRSVAGEDAAPDEAAAPGTRSGALAQWKRLLAALALVLAAVPASAALWWRVTNAAITAEELRIQADLARERARLGALPAPVLSGSGTAPEADIVAAYRRACDVLDAVSFIDLSIARVGEPRLTSPQDPTSTSLDGKLPREERRARENVRAILTRARIAPICERATAELAAAFASARCPEPPFARNEVDPAKLTLAFMVVGNERAATGDVRGAARAYLGACRLGSDVERTPALAWSDEPSNFPWRSGLEALGRLVTTSDPEAVAPVLGEIRSGLDQLEATTLPRDQVFRVYVLERESQLIARIRAIRAKLGAPDEPPVLARLDEERQLRHMLAWTEAVRPDLLAALSAPTPAQGDAALEKLAYADGAAPGDNPTTDVRQLYGDAFALVSAIRAVRLAVDLEEARVRTGAYALPAELPEDPFSPGTPLSAALTAGGYRVDPRQPSIRPLERK